MYKKITFNFTVNPPSQEDIESLENLIGSKLPETIINHYQKANGGEPDKYLFRFEETTLVVQNFYPIAKKESDETIYSLYQELVIADKIIPKHLVPFACDPSGDYFCFDIVNGSIVMFRSEYLPNLDESITYLSDSMENFINALEEDE